MPPRDVPSSELLNALDAWQRKEHARLGLPRTAPRLLILGHEDGPEVEKALHGARLDDPWWREAWPGPLWQGTVIICSDPAVLPVAISEADATRPVLPVRMVDPENISRAGVASELMHLRLDRLRPPTGGWPAWLRRGFAAYAARTADGTILGKRQVAVPLAAASAEDFSTLFQATDENMTDADAHLALALSAHLLHSRRRQHIGSFLDVLRHGNTTSDALAIAYGISIDDFK